MSVSVCSPFRSWITGKPADRYPDQFLLQKNRIPGDRDMCIPPAVFISAAVDLLLFSPFTVRFKDEIHGKGGHPAIAR